MRFEHRRRSASIARGGSGAGGFLVGRRWRGERPRGRGTLLLPRHGEPARFGDFVAPAKRHGAGGWRTVGPGLLDDTPMPGATDLLDRPADLPRPLCAEAGPRRPFAVDVEQLLPALQAWTHEPLAAGANCCGAGQPRVGIVFGVGQATTLADASCRRRRAGAAIVGGSMRPGAGVGYRRRQAAGEARAGINGRWIAEVPYAWLAPARNATAIVVRRRGCARHRHGVVPGRWTGWCRTAVRGGRRPAVRRRSQPKWPAVRLREVRHR